MDKKIATKVLTDILDAAPTQGLKNLRAAFEQKRVIRTVYQRGNEGCLLFHLFGINSREERQKFFASEPQLLKSTEQLITVWDRGLLKNACVHRVVIAAIETREALNKEEDQTILAVCRRISNRLINV